MILSLFLIMLTATNAYSLEDMDSIIDQLEYDLVEQEKELLNITRETTQKKKVMKRFSYDTSVIEAKLEDENKLKTVARQVNEITANIESIKDEYISLKERFIDKAESSNIAFLLKPKIKGLKGYKTIYFSIDGITIMSFENDGTMWTPAKDLKVFDSYLPYGEHEYKLQATLMIDQHDKGKIVPLYTKEFKFSGKFTLNEDSKKTVVPLKLEM